MNTTTDVTGSRSVAPRGRLVTDALTRTLHWLLALSFTGAYLTAEGEHWRALHVTLGYTMAGLLVLRLLRGLIGPAEVRLAPQWRKLGSAGKWWRQFASGPMLPQQWRQGHLLAMTATILLLLGLIAPLTLSGWVTYNDWGGEWLEQVHELLGNGLLALVLLHLGLIAGGSWLRRRNLALPMLTGRMDARAGSGPDLIRKPRRLPALLLVLAVLGFWAWQWHDAPQGLVPSGAPTAQHGDDD